MEIYCGVITVLMVVGWCLAVRYGIRSRGLAKKLRLSLEALETLTEVASIETKQRAQQALSHQRARTRTMWDRP